MAEKIKGPSHVSGTSAADVLTGDEGGSTFHYGSDGVWKGYASWNAGDPGHGGDGSLFGLSGYEQSFDVFRGTKGVTDTLVMGNGHKALFLDDTISPSAVDGPRLESIEVIKGGHGGQLIDLTSTTYAYGDVTIYAGSGDDIVMANGGNDHVKGGRGNDYLWGGSGDDRLEGTGGNDRLMGGDGGDRLSGGTGDDRLDGGRGDDLLWGGHGRDVLVGGEGADTFRFTRGDASQGLDVVRDFGKGDVLDLRGMLGKAGPDLAEKLLHLTDGKEGQVLSVELGKAGSFDVALLSGHHDLSVAELLASDALVL